MTLATNLTDVEIDESEIQSFLRSLSLSTLLPAIIALVVCILATKLLLRCFNKVLARSHIEKSFHGFLRTLVKIALYSLTVLITAGQLGVEVTSLVAIFSVAALAISLAVQGALSNLASGLVILSSRPFKVGDYIEVGSVSGTVREIGMTYTKIATIDNKIIFAPNSEITSGKVINYTTEGRRRIDLNVSASYNCPMQAVKASLQASIAAIPAILRDPPAEVYVSAYQDSSIQYLLRAWVSTEDYWPAYYALLEQIKTDFDERGIEMTYPHLNVHLDGK